MNRYSQRYFLGVDAGGTSCRARLETRQGQHLGEGKAGPATLRLGGAAAATSILEATRQALANACMTEGALTDTVACIGIAASERPDSKQALAEHLEPYGLRDPIIVSDAYTACVGAHAGKDGGIIIIGTGAIGYGLIDGTIHRVGGHGFPASDEGSGAYIGLRAVQLALYAADGLIEHTALSDRLYRTLGGSADTVATWLANAHATDFAALAPVITDADTDQSRAILSDAACKVSELIAGLNRKGINRIALMGGLSTIIRPYLTGTACLSLVAPVGNALDGALEMCRQAADTSSTPLPFSLPK